MMKYNFEGHITQADLHAIFTASRALAADNGCTAA